MTCGSLSISLTDLLRLRVLTEVVNGEVDAEDATVEEIIGELTFEKVDKIEGDADEERTLLSVEVTSVDHGILRAGERAGESVGIADKGGSSTGIVTEGTEGTENGLEAVLEELWSLVRSGKKPTAGSRDGLDIKGALKRGESFKS
ncbi:hypothetical protein RCL_jg3707.t1 [Rhizophagus clarus]|uniref:Uncharacterized protein n=1 Tax=Rhizophagus clarus TaxID=94130 RepID=A0A8H3M3E2_9GLOM|nr:hypothetical protein RCL_jg3707.t1 [Rhizophagus clarus]